ncbi:MAG: hypothetical protein ACXACB_10475, partial [Promethearchaeota archaeon]
ALEPINILKIVSAVVTVIIAIIAGIIELRLNPDYWLNRWFFLFFVTTSFGFLAYTIYHFITIDAFKGVVIPIMVSAHLLFNLTPLTLIMTVFILEKYEKVAMEKKRLLLMLGLFILMSFGYFIWTPKLNQTDWEQGIVNTETPQLWFYFVNLSRIVLFIFVVYKYYLIAKKVEDETKGRVRWFFVGVFIIVLGIIINLVGGIADSAILEILALIAIDIGIIAIVKGFLI